MENPEIQPEAQREDATEPAREESQPETERAEAVEPAVVESQQLADATFEPEAVVERTSEFQQAEAIETAFVQAVQQTAGAGEATGERRAPIPAGEESGEGEGRVMVAPMEGGPEKTVVAEGIIGPAPRVEEVRRDQEAHLPDGVAPASSDEPLGITPINLPGVVRTAGVEAGSEQVGAIPVNIPYPRPEERAEEEGGGEEGRVMVAPMEGGPEKTVVAEGIMGPAPRVEEVRRDQEAHLPDGAAPASSDEPLGITPINLPGIAEVLEAEGGPTPGDRIGDLPREPGADVPESFERADTGEPHGPEVTPINLPGPARPEGMEGTVEGVPAAATVKWETLPVDGDVSVQRGFYYGAGGEQQVGDIPMPLPRPEAGGMPGGAPSDTPQPSPGADMPLPQPDVNAPLRDADLPLPPADADMPDPPIDADKPLPPIDADMVGVPHPEGGPFPEGPIPAVGLDQPAIMVGEVATLTGEIAEGETWTPPETYLHYNQDGTVTLVDGSGNPVSSPPLYATNDGVNYYAYYPGHEPDAWNLAPYTAPLQEEEWFLYTDEDGTFTVVDAVGNPVHCPPVVGSIDGKDYYVYYPGDPTQVSLAAYSVPLAEWVVEVGPDGKEVEVLRPREWFLYTAKDGTHTVVDARGNPVPCPPVIASADGKDFYAYYPGTDQSDPANKIDFLLPYTPQLQSGWSLHTAQDGTQTVVDADGHPVSPPPYISSVKGDTFFAYYPGADLSDPASKLDLPPYSAPLQQGWSLHTGQDGTQTVVDAEGNAVSPPPCVGSVAGKTFFAYYPGTDQSDPANKLDLPLYSNSLQDTYLHVGQDGELTVVDEKGNPLPCQPLIVSPDGSFAAGKIFAYYPGDQTQAALEYYVPPSSSKKGPSP